MTPGRTSTGDEPVQCTREGCDLAADLWVHPPAGDGWRPLCERHVLDLHPSIEVRAWLESGYARPIERAPPDEPPPAPRDDRTAAFRDLVERAMDRLDRLDRRE